MTARSKPLKVPALAMVDALVCGVSILLILIVLLSQSSPEPRSIPRADLTFRCLDTDGGTAAVTDEQMQESPNTIPLDELAAEIAKRAPDSNLSMRVQLVVPLSQFICGPRVTEAVRRANDASETDDIETAPPVILLDIRHVDDVDAPADGGRDAN